MYRRILVPLDGSAFAEAAIGPAISLAEEARGLVCLLAVQWRPVEDMSQGIDASVRGDEAKRYLEDILLRFRPVTSIPISLKVRNGPAAAEEIVAEAAAAHDLIVMTSHGRGGLARAWFGSVTDECVRTSPTPVLVVRPLESEPAGVRLEMAKVVVPLDGSELAESVLPTAAHFAELLDVPMTLVRSVVAPLSYAGYFPSADSIPVDPRQLADEARDYLERIVSTRLAGLQPRPTVQVTMGPSAARDICDIAGPGGLVVMATHGRGGIRRALLGSVSDKVLRSTEGVVLVLRPGGDVASQKTNRPKAQRKSALVLPTGHRVFEA